MSNKIFLTLITGLFLGLFPLAYQSCNYLDIDEYINDMQSLDSVFQRKETTEQFLYNAYSYLSNPGKTWDADKDGAPWVLCSDEAFDNSDNGYNAFCNNLINAGNAKYVKWKTYYEGIRTTGIFLKRVTECKELSTIQLRQYIGEAQFLRAYYYFELMKQYGPVCLVPEDGFALDQPIDEILMSRNTWDECVEYVSGLLKEAAKNLPVERPSNEFGKPNQGAAYAVLSRLLLYSASPLFNGNSSYSGFINKRIGVNYFNQEYKVEKWAVAASAAKKVIDNGSYELNVQNADAATPALPINVTSDPDFYRNYPDGANGIDHFRSYSGIFNGEVAGSKNKEIIFGMAGVGIDRYMGPVPMRGYCMYGMPQKLVNAYYMVNGKTIQNGASDADYPYVETKLAADKNFSGYLLKLGTYGYYLNREMRFYATVGFNNSFYYGSSGLQTSNRNVIAKFNKGGNCSKGAVTWTNDPTIYAMTGYLCRKYQHPEDVYGGSYYGVTKPKVWQEYRLAEVYLNYVEALNELQGEGSFTIDGEVVAWNNSEVKKYFNLIRYRAGLPGITDAEASDKVKMRELILHEREIELAWEGHRYFDTRRWKLLMEEENGPVIGLAVNKTETGGFYVPGPVREVSYAYKAYSQRKYFWPIPQTEIVKNTSLDQNPGW